MVKKVIPVGPAVYSRPFMGDFDTNTPDVPNESVGILDVVDYQSYSVFFRGIKAGNGISVNLMPLDDNNPDMGNVIVLSSSGELMGYVDSVNTLGTGTSITDTNPITNGSLNIRSIQAGNGIDVKLVDNTIVVSSIPDDNELPAVWIAGSGIPSMSTGQIGDMYLDTTTGDVYSRLNSGWSLVYNLKGETGSAGTSWYAGSTPPSSLIGNNGDFYYQINQNKIWFKTNGVWSVMTIIVGSKWLNGQGAPTLSTNNSVTSSAADGDYYLDKLSGDVWTIEDGVWSLVSNIRGPSGTAATVQTSIDTSTSEGGSTVGQIQQNVRILDIIVDVTSAYESTAILSVGIASNPTLLISPDSNFVDLTTVGIYEVSVNYANTTTGPMDIVYSLSNPDNTGSATITLSYL